MAGETLLYIINAVKLALFGKVLLWLHYDPVVLMCLGFKQIMKTNNYSIQIAAVEIFINHAAAERHAVCRKGTFY